MTIVNRHEFNVIFYLPSARITVSFVIIENIRRRIGNIVCVNRAFGQYIDYRLLLKGWLRL